MSEGSFESFGGGGDHVAAENEGEGDGEEEGEEEGESARERGVFHGGEEIAEVMIRFQSEYNSGK